METEDGYECVCDSGYIGVNCEKCECFTSVVCRLNPLPAQLSHLNLHPLEVVSRYRDPQLQAGENYLYFLKFLF